jgi:hypothetical protein
LDNLVKAGPTRSPGSSSATQDILSTNQSRASPRGSSKPARGLNSFNDGPNYIDRTNDIDRSYDIDRPNDIDRSNDPVMLGDSQYGLDHAFEKSFEKSFNDPNADSADSLGLFPIDVRLLTESDFFFPPWSQESPSSNEDPALPAPGPNTPFPTTKYPTPQSTPDGPCQCTTHALSLLEAIVHHDTLATLSSVPTDLSLTKRALVHCKKLLDCAHCSSTSSFVTLLILLCQQIITSYENIIAKLCEQFNKIHPDNQFTARGHGVDQLVLQARAQAQTCNGSETLHDLATDKRLLFKDYEVDVEEEPCVFGGLTSMQLKTLVLFLAKLRGVARGWSWDTHVMMVDAVEKRVFALLRVTNSCGGTVEVD